MEYWISMSMYNMVNAVIYCPNCGATIKDFYTKEGDLGIKKVDPIGINYFSCACLDCKQSFEFKKECTPTTVARDAPFTLKELTGLGFRLSQR
jgi:hypothetical protein